MSDDLHPEIVHIRQHLLALKREQGWDIEVFMVAMSSMLTDMMRQGQTPEEWDGPEETNGGPDE